MVRKPISKERQLLVSWSFIAFNRGKVDGWNEKDQRAPDGEDIIGALILNCGFLLLLPLEKMEGREEFSFMTV